MIKSCCPAFSTQYDPHIDMRLWMAGIWLTQATWGWWQIVSQGGGHISSLSADMVATSCERMSNDFPLSLRLSLVWVMSLPSIASSQYLGHLCTAATAIEPSHGHAWFQSKWFSVAISSADVSKLDYSPLPYTSKHSRVMLEKLLNF